jgi:FkbM family methyltransferase
MKRCGFGWIVAVVSETEPSRGLAGIWAHHRRNIPYQVGYWLDKVGCALLSGAPSLGRLYAKLISPRGIRLERYPGWTFGAEYYIERTWPSLRRGVLLEHAVEHRLKVPVTVRWYDGLKVDVMLGNDHSLCLYVSGTFEPNEFVFLGQILKPGMTVLDVGANEGLYTLFSARRVGATGRVVAFEPSSRERRKLQHNVTRNQLGNVTVVPVAIGSSEGTAALQIASGVHSGHNTLGALVYEDAPAVGVEHVPVERLDSVVDRLGIARVDVIKIDVEGAEMHVLDGARKTLTTHRPLLLVEANDEALRAQGASTDSLLAFLRDELAYRILAFSHATGGVEPLGEGSPASANIVAVPSERLSELLARV